MANTTIRGAQSVHGQNPQFLIEYTIRMRIYEDDFWKEHCFALTAETIIDKAIELKAIGGVHGGNMKPTQFICLLLKLLQIQPEKEILVEYLLADEFKYLRALASMYIRMVFRANEVYELLEPLMKDFRKLRVQSMAGTTLTHFDTFIDELLREERVCDIILPRIPKRSTLEEAQELGPRQSALLNAMEGREDEKRSSRSRSGTPSDRSRSKSRSKSKSRSPPEDGEMGRYISRSPSRSRSRSPADGPAPQGGSPTEHTRFRSRTRSVSPDRFRSRSRSISPDRMEES